MYHLWMYMLGADDRVEDGSQGAQMIALVAGPDHSCFVAWMGFYVLRGVGRGDLIGTPRVG